MPILSRRKTASASSFIAVNSCPATATVPSLGRSRPASTIIIVDLPEPDGPTSAAASPASSEKSIPRRM